MLPYGVERTGSGISCVFWPMCRTKRKWGIPPEQIPQDRLWNKRPDTVAFKIPTKTKTGVICLLEFKRKSDVTSHHIVRPKRVVETQYVSLKSTLVITMQRQGWKVEQVSFITGARSLNEEEIKKNLAYFGRSDHGGTSGRPANGSSDHGDTSAWPGGWSTSPLINSLTAWHPNKIRKHKEREKQGEE